jgi:hypothetical protein
MWISYSCIVAAKYKAGRGSSVVALGLVSMILTGCHFAAGGPAGVAASVPSDAAAPTAQAATVLQTSSAAQPFDEAVANLTDALLAKADLPASGRRPLIIDPLIDRATGVETAATRSIGATIASRVHDRYSQFELRPFSVASLDEQPLAVLGSIAAVAAPGSTAPAAIGRQPTIYRIWAVLADVRTNRVLTREMVWVRADDIDQTPTAFFRDSPAWTPDPVAAAYIRTCSSMPGTPIDPVYLRALRAQALIADAVVAYDAGRYREALARYSDALREPGGEQLRALNGVYLSEQALGRRRTAEAAFARLVDYGLAHGRLAVKFLFRPGSTAFWPDPAVSGPYPMWLRQIAIRVNERAACLVVDGHTSVVTLTFVAHAPPSPG